MIRVQLTSLINRPVEDVWAYLTSADHAADWMTGVLEAGQISEGPIAVGTRFRKVQRFFGWRTDMTYEIVEYEPNRVITYRTAAGPLTYAGCITLEAVSTGTRLSYRGTGELWGPFKLTEPLVARVMKRRFAKDFNRLRQLMKAQVRVGI